MEEVIENAKIVYDPNKKYTWSPEDTFELSGKEFGLILNTLRAMLSTPEAQLINLVTQANSTIEQIVASSVEEGKVIEVIEPPKE